MFITNKENLRCQYSISTCTQHMDINYTHFCNNYSCHTHLPRRNFKIYYNKEANSHLATTPSLQCYIAQLPSTPHYEGSTLEVNISLDMANLNTINISSLDFCIWQLLGKHQNKSQLQHIASIPSVPVDQLYKHMVNGFNISHLLHHLKSQQETQIQSGHCFLIQEFM